MVVEWIQQVVLLSFCNACKEPTLPSVEEAFDRSGLSIPMTVTLIPGFCFSSVSNSAYSFRGARAVVKHIL